MEIEWEHISTDKTWLEVLEHYYSLCCTNASRRKECFKVKMEHPDPPMRQEKVLTFKRYVRKMGLLPSRAKRSRGDSPEGIPGVDHVADDIVHNLLEEVMNQVDENESAENVIAAITGNCDLRRRSSVSRAMILDNLPRLRACAEESLGMSPRTQLCAAGASGNAENASNKVEVEDKALLNMQRIVTTMIADIDKQILESIETEEDIGSHLEEDTILPLKNGDDVCAAGGEGSGRASLISLSTKSSQNESLQLEDIRPRTEKSDGMISNSDSLDEGSTSTAERAESVGNAESDLICMNNSRAGCLVPNAEIDGREAAAGLAFELRQKFYSVFGGENVTETLGTQQWRLGDFNQLSLSNNECSYRAETQVTDDSLSFDFMDAHSTESTPNRMNVADGFSPFDLLNGSDISMELDLIHGHSTVESQGFPNAVSNSEIAFNNLKSELDMLSAVSYNYKTSNEEPETDSQVNINNEKRFPQIDQTCCRVKSPVATNESSTAKNDAIVSSTAMHCEPPDLVAQSLRSRECSAFVAERNEPSTETTFTSSFKKKKKLRKTFTNLKMDVEASEMLRSLPGACWDINHDKELVMFLSRKEKTAGHVAFVSFSTSRLIFHLLIALFCVISICCQDEPYSLRSSNNLVLPRARSSFYGIDTISLLAKSCDRFWQEKSKSPNHWRFLKEILSRSKRFIAAINYVKVLFQI